METVWPAAAYVYGAEKLIPRIYRHTPFAAVSESTRTELRELGIRSSIDLLPNGVDLESYTHCEQERSRTPMIGYLGRLKKYKCVHHFLHALPAVVQEIPDLRVSIVGDGDDRKSLQRLTAELGLQNHVDFTGFVSQADKVRLLNQMWLAVNPSSKEGWGLTVIEANACGVPVIAADSPGLRDSVLHEETGLLVPHGDIDALSEQMLLLLRQNSRRQEMARQARNWAEQFSWDMSAQKAIEIINNVQSRKSAISA